MPATENYITQAAADARYQALGSLSSGTPSQVDPGDTASAGVSTSASRADHQHAVAITSSQLVPTAAWSSWTPTLANITLGNGTMTGRYTQIGKSVHYRLSIVFGTTSSMGTGPTFTLPVAPATYLAFDPVGSKVQILDSGTTIFQGTLEYASGSIANIFALNVTGSNVNRAQISSSVPMTWATGDTLFIAGTYEAA